MKSRAKALLLFLFFIVLTVRGFSLAKESTWLEAFEFQGQKYSLIACFSPLQVDLVLKKQSSTRLSTGMAGENILLGTRIGKDNFYVFWLNYREKSLRLAYYDHRRNRSRILPLQGFRFFALPEIVLEEGDLRELYFLGNDSGNDDIFHYDLETGELHALTRTPFSEKGFTMKTTASGVEIETRSLWKSFRYGFDPRERRCRLLEERALPRARRRAAAAFDPSRYYNTYIGFGDSITRGQWEGKEWPELCFLAKTGEMLAPIYGPTWSINLGIGGTQTYEGAERVESDLDQHPAFYFLLMYGVNDVWRREFSLASSLESLEFMVDAALARSMRVIISTLTPRKDTFSLSKYYWDNLRALSASILELARRKGVSSIDPLTAFMNTNPPDGWKALLESVNPPYAKGNHPNEEGHRLIASLFAPALAAFPPLPPQNIQVLNPLDKVNRKAFWDANFESDFSHFNIEFGFKAQNWNHSFTSAASHYTFPLFSFLPQLFFRIQTVDRGNQRSAFTIPEPTGGESARRIKQQK